MNIDNVCELFSGHEMYKFQKCSTEGYETSMFRFFKDKLQYMKAERQVSRSPELPETSSKLTENLNDNLITIMEKYRNSSDFLKREILLDGHSVAILADE